MKPAIFLAVLTAALGTACAGVPGARVPTGEHKGILEVAAGEVNEICPQLFADQRIEFDFEADRPLLFNFHYHHGEDVTYPVAEQRVARHDGHFTAPEENHYCLMWTGMTETTRIRYRYRLAD